MREYETIHEAYLAALEEVYFDYEYLTAPRGLPIREKLNYMFTITNPENTPIVTKDEARNRVIERYTRKETELYDACTNKVDDFAQASKFWKKLANPDGTVNSAYGYLIWK